MNTTSTTHDWIAIQPQDDVIIALRDYTKGETVNLLTGFHLHCLMMCPKDIKSLYMESNQVMMS